MTIYHSIFLFIASFSLTFGFKETALFEKPRIWLIGLHPFFYKLIDCYYCLGFWVSIFVLLLDTFGGLTGLLFLWGLTGAIISLIMSGIIDRIFTIPDNSITIDVEEDDKNL